MDEKIKNKLLSAQKGELTEHIVYGKLSKLVKDANNKKILKHISEDELRHSEIWKRYTKKDVKPSTLKIWKYYLISKIFGLTFGIKLMENGEKNAQTNYKEISKIVPNAKKIKTDEIRHEKNLINMINEEKLKYVGSVVLGLNDALVELTGAIAGLSFALQNTRLIAMVGLITGIAAALSMASSEYLSTKSEEGELNPLRASVYTGIAYIATVMLLVLPFFALSSMYTALATMLFVAIVIIFIFTFYISVAKDLKFGRRFLEMIFISLGVAGLSFVIGILVKTFLGVEI